MKLSKYIFTAMVAVAAFASCQKEMPGPQVEPIATKEITLTVSNPLTKVVMDNASGNMLWGENESIAVVFHIGAFGYYVYKFDQISEGGSSSATFRGTVDESYTESNISEVFYPYVEGYELNDYRNYGVSTNQNNLVLNSDGQYELGRIPLHWARETMGDNIILKSDRSAIVRLAKEDVTHSNGSVNVAFYSGKTKIRDYTVHMAVENGNLKDDLAFLVDVPEIERIRQVIKPAFVLNESDNTGLKRAAIHTGWNGTNAPKTIVPSKRYNLKPYVYFHNLNVTSDNAYVVIDNEKLKEVWRSPKVHNVEWGECREAMPGPYDGGNDYEEGKGWVMQYDRQNLAFSVGSSTQILWMSNKLVDTDGADLFAYGKTDYELNWDSPEGMTGTLDGRECVVMDLGGSVGKVAVAKKNIGATSETDYGTYFYWTDALAQQNSNAWGAGWRMPHKEEVEAFVTRALAIRELSSEIGLLRVGEISPIYFPYGGCYRPSIGDYPYRGGSFMSHGVDLTDDSFEYNTTAQAYGFDITDGNISVTQSDAYGYEAMWLFNVRPFHKLPITRNTPVGYIGLLEGKECMVVNLIIDGQVRKVAMTTMNEGANSYDARYKVGDKLYLDCFGTHYSFAEAQALCNGTSWRVPSLDEWRGLVNCYEKAIVEGSFKHRIDESYSYYHTTIFNVTSNSSLIFPSAGSDGTSGVGTRGFYWTSSPAKTEGSYKNVLVQGPNVYLDENGRSKTSKLSVRLIHDMPQ